MKNINLKLAAYINIVIALAVIILHIFIILQIIPFNWVSGGRLPTYEMQRQVSIISIIILLITIPINLWASKIILKNKLIVLLKIMLYILFAYFSISIFMQILGTLFEKIGMSILCIISSIMYFRLAIEKHK
jgi:hypothetical protein